MKLPTDYEILKKIYDMYYDEFINYDPNNPSRKDKVLIPIDCNKIALEMNCNSELIFARLYFYLARKHKLSDEEGNSVTLFYGPNKDEKERHLVHYSFLSAVLADIESQKKITDKSVFLSWLSIGIATIAVVISLFK